MTVKVELSISPTTVVGDTLLDICGAVRNLGTSSIDTRIWSSVLLVNGKPSESWAWAIANGLRDEREFALPPGERVEFRRSLPVSSILPETGLYELVLKVGEICSNKIDVTRR